MCTCRKCSRRQLATGIGITSERRVFQDPPPAGRLKEQRRLTSLASSRALLGDALLIQITPQFLILVANRLQTLWTYACTDADRKSHGFQMQCNWRKPQT